MHAIVSKKKRVCFLIFRFFSSSSVAVAKKAQKEPKKIFVYIFKFIARRVHVTFAFMNKHLHFILFYFIANTNRKLFICSCLISLYKSSPPVAKLASKSAF
jgi:hypothetical protein